MIEYSFSENVLDTVGVTPPQCFLCGNKVDHDNYSNSCEHLKLVFSNEGTEFVWLNRIEDLMKDFDEEGDEGDEGEYDYLLDVSQKLNDDNLMITVSGVSTGCNVHFVFSHS